MPLDVQSALYDQIWSLLETYKPFTDLVDEGNRIKTSDDPPPSPGSESQFEPGDLPFVRIDVAEDTTGDRMPTVIDDDPGQVDMGVPITLNVEIKIVHDLSMLNEQTEVEAAVRGALLRAGRKLGIDWVSRYVDRGVARRQEKSRDTGNKLRWITRRKLTVSAFPLRSLLTRP